MGWIGVDLDGTLAHFDEWTHHTVIGKPIPLMVNRVKEWLAAGKEVKIFTARIVLPAKERAEAIHAIQKWCEEHLGERLEITESKDMHMLEYWDDRAVGIICNTGILATSIRDNRER